MAPLIVGNPHVKQELHRDYTPLFPTAVSLLRLHCGGVGFTRQAQPGRLRKWPYLLL